MSCGPIPLTSTLEVYVSVTSQCSHIAVGVLWSIRVCLVAQYLSTSALEVSVRITSQCSHSGSRFPDYLSSALPYV